MKLIVFGNGGHGMVIGDSAKHMNLFSDVIFFDDILGAGKSFEDLFLLDPSDYEIVFGIGDNKTRYQLAEKIKKTKLKFATIIHPSLERGSSVEIGEGSAVMAGTCINIHSKIGDHCVVNTGSTIDHHCVIGDGAHIGPGCHIAGGVTVGPRTLLGVGSSVIPGVKIGKDAVIGAGSAVINNVPDGARVVGAPAK